MKPYKVIESNQIEYINENSRNQHVQCKEQGKLAEVFVSIQKQNGQINNMEKSSKSISKLKVQPLDVQKMTRIRKESKSVALIDLKKSPSNVQVMQQVQKNIVTDSNSKVCFEDNKIDESWNTDAVESPTKFKKDQAAFKRSQSPGILVTKLQMQYRKLHTCDSLPHNNKDALNQKQFQLDVKQQEQTQQKKKLLRKESSGSIGSPSKSIFLTAKSKTENLEHIQEGKLHRKIITCPEETIKITVNYIDQKVKKQSPLIKLQEIDDQNMIDQNSCKSQGFSNITEQEDEISVSVKPGDKLNQTNRTTNRQSMSKNQKTYGRISSFSKSDRYKEFGNVVLLPKIETEQSLQVNYKKRNSHFIEISQDVINPSRRENKTKTLNTDQDLLKALEQQGLTKEEQEELRKSFYRRKTSVISKRPDVIQTIRRKSHKNSSQSPSSQNKKFAKQATIGSPNISNQSKNVKIDQRKSLRLDKKLQLLLDDSDKSIECIEDSRD